MNAWELVALLVIVDAILCHALMNAWDEIEQLRHELDDRTRYP